MMDILKPLEEVTEPDERWANFGYPNPVDFSFRPVALPERHAAIVAISLTPSVPEYIREHFETAKNLLLYAWFVYRFIPVAELHAYSTAEMALKERARKESLRAKTLAPLLKIAIERRWIVDEGFSNVRREREAMDQEWEWRRQLGVSSTPEELDAQRYCKMLFDSMPYLRNDLAHGSKTVRPGGLGTLAICADLINQLFKAPQQE
ncbi:MAG: hypothetical protein HY018_12215 [Hydrogenophilales bacterium]|nr:hypothetical protein [Hydrogenophilales bacterium]